MPLSWRRGWHPQTAVALWSIETGELSPADIHPEHLTPHRLDAIHHPRVREEYLAGRRALSSILPLGRSLEVREDGKPLLPQGGFVSLSHTRGYAAALFHPERACGIDLEPIHREISPSLQRRFLHPEEFQQVPERGVPLVAWWCAKEAVYKGHGTEGLSFRDAIRLELQVDPDGGFQGVAWSREEGIRRWEVLGVRPDGAPVWLVQAVESPL